MKTMRGSFRAAVLMGAAASVMVFAAGAKAQDRNSNDDSWHFDNPAPNDNPWPYNKIQRLPVLAVVGDIACQPDADLEGGEAAHETCDTPKAPYTSTSLYQSQAATAQQIENMKPDLVAILGDEQYQVGQYQDFEKSFESDLWRFQIYHAARAWQPRVL